MKNQAQPCNILGYYTYFLGVKLCKHSLLSALSWAALLGAGALPATARDLAPVPPPSLSGYQKNLAKMNMGARIIPLTRKDEIPTFPAEGVPDANPYTPVWLGENEARGLPLTSGPSLFVVALKGMAVTNKFSFENYGAAGRVTIYGSPTLQPASASGWTKLGNVAMKPGDTISLEFPAAEMQYLLMEFQTDTPGEISGLGLYGEDTLDQATALFLENPDQIAEMLAAGAKPVPFDFASLFAGTVITAISSGDPAKSLQMIDDDTSTGFAFDSSDNEHLFVVDLRYDYVVDLISLVIDAGPGTLDLFAVNTLPGAGEAGTGPLDTSFLNEIQPVATQTFSEGAERSQINLESLQQRYYIMRWTAAGSGSSNPLTIYEVSVIGQVPESLSEVVFTPRTEFFGADDPTVDENNDLDNAPSDRPDPFSP